MQSAIKDAAFIVFVPLCNRSDHYKVSYTVASKSTATKCRLCRLFVASI